MPVSDSEYRAALTRAGDASAAEAVACRERDEAREHEAKLARLLDAQREAFAPVVSPDDTSLAQVAERVVRELVEARADRDAAIGGALWWPDSAHWNCELRRVVEKHAPVWAGRLAALDALERRATLAERERDEAREDARVTHHRARVACQTLVEETGAAGPCNVEDAAVRCATALHEARAVIRGVEAALGASATGDLAADVARAVARADDADEDARRWCNELRDLAAALGCPDIDTREDFGEPDLPMLYAWRDSMIDPERDAERAATVATLRETQHALARVTADLDAARDTLDGYERDDRAVRRVVAALPFSSANGNSRHLRLTLWEPTARRGTLSVAVGDSHEGTNSETAIGAIAGAVRSIAARIEAAPPVEAAAVEVPHRVGDVWRHAHGEGAVTQVIEPPPPPSVEPLISIEGGYASRADQWRESGWRRVRCAPAVGDAVQTAGGEGVKAGELVALAGEE